MMDDETRAAVRRRLRRVAGQVDGLIRMVDEERYCVDILLQVSAVQAAIGKAGATILQSHIKTCFAQAMASGDDEDRQRKLDELFRVLDRHAKIRSQ